MKYKAKFKKYERLSDEQLLEVLLNERGIKNVDKFLNLDKTVLHNARDFENIKEGIYLIDKYILNGGKICIIVDSDVDGYTSSAFTYLELKKLNPNLKIDFVLHKGKEHGIVLDELNELNNFDFDLLIVPDGGSSDYTQIEELYKINKEVLILDHHIYEKSMNKGIRINCQDSTYPNKNLSGVGVCYKFFHLYEELLNYKHYSDHMLDLVAIGQIGDMVDLRDFETRYLCLLGIELLNQNKGNKFIQAILQRQEGRIKGKVNFTKIAFNIVPLINAVVRDGKQTEKEDVFKALIEMEETREYQPRRKNKNDPKPPVELQDLQTYMARVIINIKGRQDRSVAKEFEQIKDKIHNMNLDNDNNKIIIIDGTEEIDKNHTGYVANKIASYYKRPALVCRQKDENSYGGSGRNYSKFDLENLRTFLLDTKEFESIDGHNNAFGITINKNNITSLQQKINKLLKNKSIEDTYFVEYAIPMGKLREKHILQIGQFENMWGGTVNEPIFTITDVYVDIADIQLMGDKQNVLRITKTVGDSKINFVKLQNAKDTYNKILGRETKGISKRKSNRIGLDIIGKFKINEWEGNQYPQIEIIDFNLLDSKEIRF